MTIKLSSPRLALFILLFLAAFIGIASWLPWTLDRSVKAPGWAFSTGLDRPFSSAPFLIAVFLLFTNTLACTVERTRRSMALFKGKIPRAKSLAVKGEHNFIVFLKSQGFRTDNGPPYFKNRLALTRGWLFHAGLVLLIAGVLIQQGWYDGGSFEIAEGELVRLSEAGVIFDRHAGPFSAPAPPDIEIALEQFDPYLHQEGYAPDRASTVMIRTQGREQRILLDRAEGVSIQGLSIYQAIPFGIALNIEIEESGLRSSLHLRELSPRHASGEFRDPSGRLILFFVESERELSDPLGTGKLRIFFSINGEKLELAPSQTFVFGGRTAKILSLSRWSGFTYSRSPGVFLVFTGFFLLLAGTAVLLVPAGIATAGEEETPETMRIYVTQGADDFAENWHRFRKGHGL